MRPGVIERGLVIAGGLATIAVALAFVAVDGAPAAGHTGSAIVVFVVAIGLSTLLIVRAPGGELMAPVSQAIGLGMAFASEMSGIGALTYYARGVVLASATGLLCGAALRSAISHRPIHWGHLASRQISTAVAAVLFRALPIFDGRTGLERYPDWSASRWRMTMLMFAVGIIAVGVEIVLITLVSKGPRQTLPALVDNVKGMGPVAFAALSTGIAIALGLAPLGVLSIVLMSFPLLLLHYAIRQRVKVRDTRRQTIAALSRLTEVAGYTPSGHSRRVADLCMRVGVELHLTERELVMLEDAALLHDIGQVYLDEPIPGGATVEAAPRDQAHIAHQGADIVLRTEALDDVAIIMEAQATQYRLVREMGESVPLASRIIKVCNAYDDLTRGMPQRHAEAVERLYLGLGYEYDPAVLDALVRVAGPRTAHTA